MIVTVVAVRVVVVAIVVVAIVVVAEVVVEPVNVVVVVEPVKVVVVAVVVLVTVLLVVEVVVTLLVGQLKNCNLEKFKLLVGSMRRWVMLKELIDDFSNEEDLFICKLSLSLLWLLIQVQEGKELLKQGWDSLLKILQGRRGGIEQLSEFVL